MLSDRNIFCSLGGGEKRRGPMKVGTKVLASFEAGMNSPNLPWHVNITTLKHRSRFGEVPCFRQVE